MRMRAAAIVVGVLVLLMAAGCSGEQRDWRSAQAADTIESYNRFLAEHPRSELVPQARARIVQLAEDRDWKRASAADTADAYRQFLARHPHGKWSQEARIRMQNFALANAPPGGTPPSGAAPPAPAARAGETASPGSAAAARQPTPSTAVVPESARQPASAAPTRRPATHARRTTIAPGTAAQARPSTSRYAIQLGAFSTRQRASSAWRQLHTRFARQLEGLAPDISAASTHAGHLYRLRTRVGGAARARAICTQLKQHSQPCVVVAPRR